MATKRPNTFQTIDTYLSTSRHGIRQPEIQLGFGAKTHWRIEHAALFEIAAKVERATPENERWVVGVNQECNTVYLELGEGDEAEAARGMAVIERIVAKIKHRA